MKELLAVVAIALSVLVIYTLHQDRVRKASQEAAEIAAANAESRARAEVLRWKKAASDRPPQLSTPEPKLLTAVGISRVLEPHILTLFSALDRNDPADLVPPLQIIKERILDKRQHVETPKATVYDQAIRTLDLMIATAEERTATLDAMLQIAARPAASLDGRTAVSNSNAFFLQTTLKRWESGKGQRKAAIDQAMTALRSGEREWNKLAGENAPVEDYSIGHLPPVMVKLEPSTGPQNSLDRGAYDQRQKGYSWRGNYYNQYNQGSMSRY